MAQELQDLGDLRQFLADYQDDYAQAPGQEELHAQLDRWILLVHSIEKGLETWESRKIN